MSLLKVVNESYVNKTDLNKVIEYLFLGYIHDKTDIACWGINPRDIESMVNSMNFIKQGFGKIEGKQLHHFIISICPRNKITTDKKFYMQNGY